MNKAEELDKKVAPVFTLYDLSSAQKEVDQIKRIGGQSARDIYDLERWAYYQWLPCLVRVTKPKQIVELGGAWGTSALMMLSELPDSSKLYSITLAEEPAFKYIQEDYFNLVKIIGDDLDLNVWPKDMELGATDIWFIAPW